MGDGTDDGIEELKEVMKQVPNLEFGIKVMRLVESGRVRGNVFLNIWAT